MVQLGAALALVLLAGRPDPWKSAQQRFPPLRSYEPTTAPASPRQFVAAGKSWVRLGGACRQVVPRERGPVADVGLCSGNRAGHYWKRWVELRLGEQLEVSQALLEHGVDRRGDTRHFRAEEREWREPQPGAELSYELSAQCWAANSWSSACPDGTRHECSICNELRLLGGKERAAHVYGSLEIVADLDKPCDAPCEGGMPMAEAEALDRLLRGKRFAWKGAGAALLHRTRAGCEAAGAPDLLPEPPACEEPELP